MKPKDPKRCTKCGEHKPRAEFYPHSKAKNGVSAWCRDCTKRVASEKQKAVGASWSITATQPAAFAAFFATFATSAWARCANRPAC